MTRYLEVFFLLFSHIYLFIGSLYKSAYNFLYSVYKFFEPVYIFFVHVYHFFVHVYYFLVDVFYSWYFLFIAKDYPLLLLFSILVTFIPLLGSVALFTLAERKVIATVQRRRGPNVVGTWGLLQPFADGLKLVIKETTVPNRAMTSLFLIAPSISFVLSVFGWCIIPLHANFESKPLVFADLNLGLLWLFAVSSLGAYGVLLGGWASNSKYALLGALRSAAQMISYEVSLGLTVISVILCTGSLNLIEIVEKQKDVWYVIPLMPLMVIFLVSILAETNRAPFDLPEAEAELVAGFNVEYSGIVFALFFLAEYSSMLLMGILLVILFFGGWLLPSILFFLPNSLGFFVKAVFFFFMYIFVRSNFPRLRYDQLMNICWKVFLPITLSYIVFVSSILITFDGLPVNQQGLPYFGTFNL